MFSAESGHEVKGLQTYVQWLNVLKILAYFREHLSGLKKLFLLHRGGQSQKGFSVLETILYTKATCFC